jgi:hypothetical protein
MGLVDFVFGKDSSTKLVGIADSLEPEAWSLLKRDRPEVVDEDERAKAHRHKDEIIRAREFRKMQLGCEHYADFE